MKEVRLLVLLMAVCITTVSRAQPLNTMLQASGQLETIVPGLKTGWALSDSLTGDLNKDGVADRVMVYDSDSEDSKAPWNIAIFVMIKTENGFRLADSAMRLNRFIDIEQTESSVVIPHVYLKKGCLFIETGENPTSHNYVGRSYQFRYQEDKMRLIGYSQHYTESLDPSNNNKIGLNLSTGKLSMQMGGNTNHWPCPVAKPLPGFKELETFRFPDFDALMAKPPLPKKAVTKKVK